jgi:hypothetical protein
MSTGSIESAAIATDWSKTILRGYVELPIARGSAMRGGGGDTTTSTSTSTSTPYDHVNAYVYVYEHVNGDIWSRDGKGTGGTPEDVPPV